MLLRGMGCLYRILCRAGCRMTWLHPLTHAAAFYIVLFAIFSTSGAAYSNDGPRARHEINCHKDVQGSTNSAGCGEARMQHKQADFTAPPHLGAPKPLGYLQLTATGARRKKRSLSEGDRRARRIAEQRRAYRGNQSDDEWSSEGEWEHSENSKETSFSGRPRGLQLTNPQQAPESENITQYTEQQQRQAQETYPSAYGEALEKVHEFELSDDDSDWDEPTSQAARTTSQQQQSVASLATAAPDMESHGSSTGRQLPTATQPPNQTHQSTVVAALVHQPPQQTTGGPAPIIPPTSRSAFGSNNAVVAENIADAISDTASVSSQGSGRRHPVHSDSSSRPSGPAHTHGITQEKTDTLADLVSQGIGSELLNCIELPLGYQELDSKIDSFCTLIKQKDVRYPNHPTQTACRKVAKHVNTEIRRVYSACSDECITTMWLSVVIPGVTKLRSMMGIPQLIDSSLLGNYVRDAVESPQLMRPWRHPELESNSCIFAHQHETLSKRKKEEISDRLESLQYLLLFAQRQAVDSSMLGFLMSLFSMDKCKKSFKKEPKYKTPEGTVVDAKGLFQALLADAIANAFTLDLKRCSTPEATEIGSKANVLCAHLRQEAKVRATVKPILYLVAEGDLEGAQRKANTFVQDLQQAEENWDDIEITQATAKVHAALTVSLWFALSSRKGKLASWLANRRPIQAMLRKVLGELTALIFEDNAAAARFGMQVTSVEKDPTVTSGALLMYAQVQVMASQVEARFFCQTGHKGLGKALGNALKTVTRSLARSDINGTRRQNTRHPDLSSDHATQRPSPVNLLKVTRRHSLTSVHENTPASFMSTRIIKKSRRLAGSVMALVGSASGKKLKSVLKKVEVGGKRVFADGKFLKRRWWEVLGGIVKRLRTKEQVALPLVILLSIHFFVVSVSFAAVATVATQAVGAFCVLVVVLMMLDLMQLDASLNLA